MALLNRLNPDAKTTVEPGVAYYDCFAYPVETCTGSKSYLNLEFQY